MFLQSSVDTLGRERERERESVFHLCCYLFPSAASASAFFSLFSTRRAALFPHWVFAADFPSLARSATHFINHLFPVMISSHAANDDLPISDADGFFAR